MAAKPLPSQEVLRQLLRYEPETGKLFWRERGVEWFRGNAQWTAEQNRKSWNTRNADKEAFTARNARGYHVGAVLGPTYLAHRVIWAIEYGHPVPDEIDHANLVTSDNRLTNLRAASRAENGHNQGMRVTNSSGFKGVSWDAERGKWEACISVEGRKKHLGRYESAEAAHAAYCRAARRYRGEYARTG